MWSFVGIGGCGNVTFGGCGVSNPVLHDVGWGDAVAVDLDCARLAVLDAVSHSTSGFGCGSDFSWVRHNIP